jgi:hypothetical protein
LGITNFDGRHIVDLFGILFIATLFSLFIKKSNNVWILLGTAILIAILK